MEKRERGSGQNRAKSTSTFVLCVWWLFQVNESETERDERVRMKSQLTVNKDANEGEMGVAATLRGG